MVPLRNSVKFPFVGLDSLPLHSVHDSGLAKDEILLLQSEERQWLGH
jgi:hypothetical protein